MATLALKEVQLVVAYTEAEAMVYKTTLTSWMPILTGTVLATKVDFTAEMQATPSARLDILAQAISQQIEAYTHRAFQLRTVAEYMHGSGLAEQVLTWGPVSSITTLKRAFFAKNIAATMADVEGTIFDCDGDSGRLYLYGGGYFYKGRNNIFCQYAAGYDSQAHADVVLAQQALILQAISTWREWDKQLAGLQDQSIGDQVETRASSGSSPALIDSVKDLLQPLVRYAA